MAVKSVVREFSNGSECGLYGQTGESGRAEQYWVIEERQPRRLLGRRVERTKTGAVKEDSTPSVESDFGSRSEGSGDCDCGEGRSVPRRSIDDCRRAE